MMKSYFNISLVVYVCSLYLSSAITNHNFFYHPSFVKSYVCLSCPPGTYVENSCTIPKTTGQCKLCPVGFFQPSYTNSNSCRPCVTECIYTHTEETTDLSPAVCNSALNFCLCPNKSCILNSKCPPGTEPTFQATSSQHTICRSCPDDTYSNVFSRTEMCKPMTICRPHEVAILDGNKTSDRVCISRNGNDKYITNITTITQTSNVTITVMNFTSNTGKNVDNEKITLISTLSGLLVFCSVVLIYVLYRKRHLLKNIRMNLKTYKKDGVSCDSGFSDIEEMSEKHSKNWEKKDNRSLSSSMCEVEKLTKQCSIDRETKDNRTLFSSISDVSMQPLVCGYVGNNDINLQFKSLLDSDQGNIDDSTGNVKQLHFASLKGDILVHNDDSAEDYNLLESVGTLPSHENENSGALAKQNEPIGTHLFTTETLQCSHLPTQKTILSTEWQWSEHITNQGCTLQLSNSDVITTFQPGIFLDCGSSAYCHKAVHNDILRLADELCLPPDTIITSPSPEYQMEATLAKFVEVTIPHRMPKNYKNIEVLSFSKHIGSKVELVKVPKCYDRSKADDKLDMFCVISSESVVIYTKHFSGFVCTTCKKYIEYNLIASIYGRKGLLDNRIDTLDVLLYLKGAKSTIADFETVVEEKLDKRFHHLETTRVKLLQQYEQSEGGQLQFRFGLVSESLHTWTHRKTDHGDQMVDTLVLANPEDLMSECEKHIICSPGTKWFLQRQDRPNTNCDFYVKITHKEKPLSALSTLHYVHTYIPACEDFSIPAAPNIVTIPGAITDVVMTLKENLSQQESLKLVKHMGCLGQIPPSPDRSQRDDFRYDYWYTAFIECYHHLKDQFINRVLDGLRNMGHERLVQLVYIHAPQNRGRIAFIHPQQYSTTQEGGRHTQITQPSSASTDSNKDG